MIEYYCDDYCILFTAEMRMYHVTNVPVKRNKSNRPKNQPDWEKVRVNVADDKTFDGKLVALPVACFTTTLYQGDLPTQSPYPRYVTVSGTKAKAKPETEYWRVDVPFNLHKYKIFEMAKSVIQVHLLCLDRLNATDMLLADILIMNKNVELANREDLKEYFPIDDNLLGPNEYSNNGDRKRYKHIFVNVSFINPVAITDDARWTFVKKQDLGWGALLNNDRQCSLYAWGEQHIRSSYETCKDSLNNLGAAVKNLKQIKKFMLKGKHKFLQQWKDACDSSEEKLADDEEAGVNEVTKKTQELALRTTEPSDK